MVKENKNPFQEGVECVFYLKSQPTSSCKEVGVMGNEIF